MLIIEGDPIFDELEGYLNEDLDNKLKNDCPKYLNCIKTQFSQNVVIHRQETNKTKK